MQIVKTEKEIALIRIAAERLARVLDRVEAAIAPGKTTSELNAYAEQLIREEGDDPAFLHYQPAGAPFPFPASLCISVNDEVVHGIPGERVIEEGDIVGIDLGVRHEGYHADMARTVPVGDVDATAHKLLEVTREALIRGIDAAQPGAHIGDIGHAVEVAVADTPFSIVEELGGHGIGAHVHEEPFIANFGDRGTGRVIEPGMVLAIEPIINEGSPTISLQSDGFTFLTTNRKRSAHFEHTILVTENGSEILTKSNG